QALEAASRCREHRKNPPVPRQGRTGAIRRSQLIVTWRRRVSAKTAIVSEPPGVSRNARLRPDPWNLIRLTPAKGARFPPRSASSPTRPASALALCAMADKKAGHHLSSRQGASHDAARYASKLAESLRRSTERAGARDCAIGRRAAAAGLRHQRPRRARCAGGVAAAAP